MSTVSLINSRDNEMKIANKMNIYNYDTKNKIDKLSRTLYEFAAQGRNAPNMVGEINDQIRDLTVIYEGEMDELYGKLRATRKLLERVKLLRRLKHHSLDPNDQKSLIKSIGEEVGRIESTITVMEAHW